MRVMCISATSNIKVEYLTEGGLKYSKGFGGFKLQEGRIYNVFETIASPFDNDRVYYTLMEAPIQEAYDSTFFIPLTD